VTDNTITLGPKNKEAKARETPDWYLEIDNLRYLSNGYELADEE